MDLIDIHSIQVDISIQYQFLAVKLCKYIAVVHVLFFFMLVYGSKSTEVIFFVTFAVIRTVR